MRTSFTSRYDYMREQTALVQRVIRSSQQRRRSPLVAINERGASSLDRKPAALSASEIHKQWASVSRPTARLSAQFPNGVTFKLECSRHDVSLVTAIVAPLGAQ